MVPDNTALTLIGAPLAIKVLGPTADYIGNELRQFTEKRIDNIKKIFIIASEKLGDDIEQPGAVPPKVLWGILNEGSFCDDNVCTEYFGGVLASSRSEIDRDDRGAYFISLISRLSAYQLRAHYIFYNVIKTLYNGENDGYNLIISKDWRTRVFLAFSAFASAMELSEKEWVNFNSLFRHIINGLESHKLISPIAFGEAVDIKRVFPSAQNPGVVFQHSNLGIELFFWAHGKPNNDTAFFLSDSLKFEFDTKIEIPTGYCKVLGGY